MKFRNFYRILQSAVRLCFVLSLFLYAERITAMTSFSGQAGAKTDIKSDANSDYFDPTMNLQSFFSGQFDFPGNVTVRSEFSIETADMISNGIFKDTDAKFKIDELSVTKQFLFGNFSNFFSLFAGTYEPIGSDIFLRRHFGIEPIDSMLTQSWLGLKRSSVLPFYGIGGSYILQTDIVPFAAGTFIYVNHQNTDKYEFNGDLRFACAFNNFCMDAAGGIGAPLKSENSNGDTTFLVIDELYLHAGMEMFIGNNYRGGIFAEAGFKDVKLTRNGSMDVDFSEDDLYLLIEPRIVFRYAKLYLSLFRFPKETVDSLFFIDDSLGVDVALFTDSIRSKRNTVQLGSHLSVSWAEKNLSYVKDIADDVKKAAKEEKNVKVSPFVTVSAPSCIFQTMIQIVVTNIKNRREKAVTANVSCKKFF
ncbi:hypothetical protein HRQ91_08045 [Treponema parvum]|uniref:DUF5723 domain-containing protein n=1 Tax=Treponema parvum TaxID=138851 RepID=A0A975F5M1_9SPIR|nr:hypothetical protein [Treponema parvum]QTQ14409.1 hypothetical protein HRQ91_08045 [Treponema parvum]